MRAGREFCFSELALDTTKLAEGKHTITAIAYDNAGNNAKSNVAVVVDNIPPIVNIASPTLGVTVQNIITYSVTATDDIGLSNVQLLIDNVLQKTFSSPPYTMSVDTTKLLNGTHNFQVIATDTAGNTQQQSNSVNVQNIDRTPPVVAITSPASGASVSGTITVNVSATDNQQVTRVQLYVDNKLSSISYAAPYTFTVDTSPLAQGRHSLTAIAYDAAGNYTQSSITIKTPK